MKAVKILVSLLVLSSLTLAACSAPAAAATAPMPAATQADAAAASPQANSTSAEVTLQNFSFNPVDLTVKTGTTVTPGPTRIM